MIDVRRHNRDAWNDLVDKNDRWTRPVSADEIALARRGQFSLVLTPTKAVPKSWYPPLKGLKTLCLAGAGGQQAPILAAAGADVTVFDNSPKQLGQDLFVAARDGLPLKAVEGDMRDLSVFADGAFDFIFHPCSNCFVDAVRPVWAEAFRVLKRGGTMVAGLGNPVNFLYDPDLEKTGVLQLKFAAPFSDLTSVTAEERRTWFGDGPLSFGHTLEVQIGGQLDAGFHLIGFYEDDWGGVQPVDKHLKSFIATRALKP